MKTQIVRGHSMSIAWVCLLVLPVLCVATAGAQDKGDSSKPDKDRPSETAQAHPPEVRSVSATAAGSAGEREPACSEQSAVSEMGCSQPERVERPQSFWSSEALRTAGTSFGNIPQYYQPEPRDLKSLSQMVDDPLAPLMTSTSQTTYSQSLWGIRGTPGQAQTNYRSVIPLSVFGTSNILRVSIPYAGSGDAEVTDLFTFSDKWGHWGAGAVASFGTNNGFAINSVRAGPAFGFVAKKGNWLLGVVNKNLFSREAAVSSLQPVIAYQLGRGWSLGAGELQYQIDWSRRGFSTLPVGFQVGKVVDRGSQSVRVFVSPHYNLRNTFGAPRWTMTVGVSILLPGR